MVGNFRYKGYARKGFFFIFGEVGIAERELIKQSFGVGVVRSLNAFLSVAAGLGFVRLWLLGGGCVR